METNGQDLMIDRLTKLAGFTEKGIANLPKGDRRNGVVRQLALLDQRIARMKDGAK